MNGVTYTCGVICEKHTLRGAAIAHQFPPRLVAHLFEVVIVHPNIIRALPPHGVMLVLPQQNLVEEEGEGGREGRIGRLSRITCSCSAERSPVPRRPERGKSHPWQSVSSKAFSEKGTYPECRGRFSPKKREPGVAESCYGP